MSGMADGIYLQSLVSLINDKVMNILFVCSMNQWRSPTAEAIFKNSSIHNVRSAGTGTSGNARIKISQALIGWADMIFVMEKQHKQIMIERFRIDKQIIVLDIPDEYKYMDPELIEMIKTSVAPYLE